MARQAASGGLRRRVEPQGRVRMASDDRRAQLLSLGIEIFALRGWDEVQIDDVARAAGISKGLLYHYFSTKRDFYAEVVREASRRLLETTDTPDTMAPLERLSTGLGRYVDFAERHAPAYVTLLRGGIGSDPQLAEIVEDTRRQFLSRILRSLGSDDAPALLRLTLRGWLGFVEATSVDWLERKDLPRDELLALWTRALLNLLPES